MVVFTWRSTDRCRNTTFTCIDCNVTFSPDTYREHNKCVTEDQRYGGANYVAKEMKGEVKQQKWLDQIRDVINKMPGSAERALLKKAVLKDNMPRKQKPFINFLKNACGCRDQQKAESAWKVLQEALQKAEQPAKTENDGPVEEEKPAKKEAPVEEEESPAAAEEPAEEDEAPAVQEKPKKKKKKEKFAVAQEEAVGE
ncbi:Zf-LYAR domain-containing protein [Aphelenchoides fujianensis]|nr:Zf-LYAR domain-containing protein [Aphelenchoides fujianensis]